jgi:GDP-L-fucose synthase
MVQAYRKQYGFNGICVMPTNLYGPGDNFDLQQAHVLPALLRRIHEAKVRRSTSVTVWGSGAPRREFLHVDDLADAVLYLLHEYDGEPIVNIGWGKDISILELAELLVSVIDYNGQLLFDSTKPDGTPRKLLDVGRLTGLGWAPTIALREGVRSTYAWFTEHLSEARL